VFLPNQTIDAERSTLLASRLRERGYVTAAFTGGGMVNPRIGFGAGFDLYDVADVGGVREKFARPATSSAGTRLAPVLDWVDRHADQPFFLFVHTYLVHNYSPSPEFLPPGEADGRSAERLWRRADLEGDRAAMGELRRRYEATLRQADAEIVAPLLAHLRRGGRDEEVVVALVSDHGEAFLEHEDLGHGRSLFAEQVRVPFLLRGPGIPAGVRRPEWMDLADVGVTLAALLGLPPRPDASGRDMLAGEVEGRPLALCLEEWAHGTSWEALLSGEWKLVSRARAGSEPERMLFSLNGDLLDQEDLGGSYPEVVSELAGELERLRSDLSEAQADLGELEPAMRERLEALGYAVEGE